MGGNIMKRKRLAAILLTAAMMVSAVSTTASAADTVDKYYYKPSITAGEWISTVAHYKETTSEVYVAPDNSPSGYSQMRTYCYVSGVPTNKTTAGTVRLADGRKYAINNYVYEDGDYTSNEGVRMYLRMSPTSGSGMMDGHWSPDYAYESGVTYV